MVSAGKSGAPALSVDHLSKRFGDRMAFDDVSFAVGHGEVFGTLLAPTSGLATKARRGRRRPARTPTSCGRVAAAEMYVPALRIAV